MNRDEILAKSREENKDTDERLISLQQKAGAISGSVGIALCGIIALLEGIFGDSVLLFYGCFSIWWGIVASNSLVLAIAEKRKYVWFAIISILMFICFMSKLVLELI